ncbi:M23 family metallopeptidase [Colwellia sp. RE-S-Sl-9]
MKQVKKKVLIAIVAFVFLFILLIPEQLIIPVAGANKLDWHKDTFWYEPWGKSGVHKGIDIFADKGASLLSASHGIVLYTGNLSLGGKVIIILAPKWRIHYYAHLDSIIAKPMQLVNSGEAIGSVGDTGNAKGKPPHLHYSIITLLPYLWKIDGSNQGWKKAFYLDPNDLLTQ